ncbi:MAG: VWA domain-containing protein, partial [Deltaproteobacteria bacterium]|nr:VWA domain-containing protein [Deltaproteobacteria bacterium]
MRFKNLMAAGLGLCFLATALTTSTCQDYGFEELPSSVIKEKRFTVTINVASAVDILFVIDNSGSMVGEQQQLAQSFSTFVDVLDERFGIDKYHIAIITAGVLSEGCPMCTPDYPASCMNETGESGVFQDRKGSFVEISEDMFEFSFTQSPECRVIETSAEKSCFYDNNTGEGTGLVGITGCGYERGLAPIRMALGDLLTTTNTDFLRENATLVVVVVSDEDDCGEVGDITEGIQGGGGRLCYYAAKEVGPNNTYSHPDDVTSKPYRLTPVDEYYDFLMGLKDNRAGMVKFAAIVGVNDVNDLNTTTIEYEDDSNPNSAIVHACSTPGCTGRFCHAEPGTRYIRLAQKFGIGKDGFIDTICQADFSATMEKLGTFVSCPRVFNLSDEILDPGLANILVNDEPVPRYSCSDGGSEIQECENTADTSCTCVETWSYHPPTGAPEAPGGTITFADHYDP